MAKVYVAGLDLERAHRVMQLLKSHGHKVTYDWATSYKEEDQGQKAFDERQGIRDADIVVYLWEKGQESARYEAGMAMGLGKPIVVVGHQSFFFGLPEVTLISSDDAIIDALGKVQF